MELLPPSQQFDETSRLNKWIYQVIEPFLQGRILEVRSKTNSISAIFAEKERPIHLSISERTTHEELRTKYQGLATIRALHSIKFERSNFEERYKTLEGHFDTVIILTAAENGLYNKTIVDHSKYLLRTAGNLIVLAPAYTVVLNDETMNVEEWRRYNRRATRQLLNSDASDVEVIKTKYFTIMHTNTYNSSGLSVLAVARKK